MNEMESRPNLIIALDALEEISNLPHCDRYMSAQIARDAIKEIRNDNSTREKTGQCGVGKVTF